jgi:Prokaryotic RING finger family 1/Protein of unknown function (DUF3137)
MELLVIFVIIFIIYGAGWIWQTVNDILRDANRVQWEGAPAGGARPARVLLGGHDLGDLGRAYQRFAELRNGELHNRQLFQSPKVSFTHHGARALLSVYEPGDSTGVLHTQLTYTVPEGWPYRLEVFPQRRPDDGVSSSPTDIRLNDSEFDPRFVVKSNDESFARDYLDPAMRRTLEDLRNLLGNDRLLVSMNSSRLMVRKESVIGNPDDLAVFADLAGRLHDRIEFLWQRASGIEILEEPAQSDGHSSVCQICDSAIDPESRVVCRRCNTPHHQDCWEWNGQCSTYACGEKRFATKK